MGKLEGKVAVITGAALGIGRSTALLFAQEGAKVIVADRREAEGKQIAQEIAKAGGRARFVKTDVSQPEQVQAMVQAAAEKFGRLDILFNNAGVQELAPLVDFTLESWDRVINILQKGVFLGMKYAIPEMLKTGGGSIINTASVVGLVGLVGSAAYCAAKGGIIQLTKVAALEHAKQGIRVNVICPGVIETPMVDQAIKAHGEYQAITEAMSPMGRLGQPEEVAQMALFLASDDSSFCTGAPFIVDGGFMAGQGQA